MPRRAAAQIRPVEPDSIHRSKLVSQVINKVMLDGKKSTAERIVYDALALIGDRSDKDPLEILESSIKTLTPSLEVRSRRVGGATYQVPVEVPSARARPLAVRWLVEFARQRREKTMAQRLANELMDAQSQQGGAYKGKDDIYRMAQANKAFAHYRWYTRTPLMLVGCQPHGRLLPGCLPGARATQGPRRDNPPGQSQHLLLVRPEARAVLIRGHRRRLSRPGLPRQEPARRGQGIRGQGRSQAGWRRHVPERERQARELLRRHGLLERRGTEQGSRQMPRRRRRRRSRSDGGAAGPERTPVRRAARHRRELRRGLRLAETQLRTDDHSDERGQSDQPAGPAASGTHRARRLRRALLAAKGSPGPCCLGGSCRDPGDPVCAIAHTGLEEESFGT